MSPENTTIASVIFAAFIVFSIFIIYKALRLPKEKREGPLMRALTRPTTPAMKRVAVFMNILFILTGNMLISRSTDETSSEPDDAETKK
jgi:hypothetical protein